MALLIASISLPVVNSIQDSKIRNILLHNNPGQPIQLTVGKCDNFDPDLPVGGEQTNPRQELLDFIDQTYSYSGSRECDEFGSDRHWAHTFDLTGLCVNCCIDEAFLEIMVCNNGSNDRLNLGLLSNETRIVAIELDSVKLAGFTGYDLTDIRFSTGCDEHGFRVEDYVIYYATGSLPDLFTNAQILASGTSSGTGWDTVTVPPQPLPNTGSAFIIVQWMTPVAGYDTDNTDNRGGWMCEQGSTNNWVQIDSLGIDAVWGIDAGISTDGSPITWLTYNDGFTDNNLPKYSWAWSSPLSTLIDYEDCGKITVDLTSKPDVMEFMNNNCYLDVDIQDDSAVDCANLTLYCCGCCCLEATTDLSSGNSMFFVSLLNSGDAACDDVEWEFSFDMNFGIILSGPRSSLGGIFAPNDQVSVLSDTVFGFGFGTVTFTVDSPDNNCNPIELSKGFWVFGPFFGII